MNLSPEVQEIMDAEIDRLLANPAYDLEPVRRLQVFQAVGPSAIPEQNARLVSQAVSLPKLTIADRIRARIAFLSARKVAAFWESACQETDRDNNNEPGREDTVDDHAQYLRQLQIVPIEELSVFQVPRPYIPHHILEMAEMALDGVSGRDV